MALHYRSVFWLRSLLMYIFLITFSALWSSLLNSHWCLISTRAGQLEPFLLLTKASRCLWGASEYQYKAPRHCCCSQLVKDQYLHLLRGYFASAEGRNNGWPDDQQNEHLQQWSALQLLLPEPRCRQVAWCNSITVTGSCVALRLCVPFKLQVRKWKWLRVLPNCRHGFIVTSATDIYCMAIFAVVTGQWGFVCSNIPFFLRSERVIERPTDL